MDTSHRPLGGPWEGETRIIVGIEIGTNDSQVSFAFLQNGAEMTVHRVTQWPGQEAQNQYGRTPTLVWYDKSKKAVSFGAEALTSRTEKSAEENGWILAKCFPLHLYPSDSVVSYGPQPHPLPTSISLQQIYLDFLLYLLQNTETYFTDHILDGKQIWATYKPTMDVVITGPPKWGFREQEFLRNTVVKTGFIDSAVASDRILFVAEFEAIAHFACYHTNIISHLLPTTSFIICDAGESMVNITCYSVVARHPNLKFNEHSSTNIQAGGALVDAAAETHLRNVLGKAGISNEDISEYTLRGMKDFRHSARRAFRDVAVDQSIEIAGTRFHSPSIGTRRGRMSLSGTTVQSFFEDSVSKISMALDSLLQSAGVSYILLTGEFGESPFLRKTLKDRYESQGHQMVLLNDSSSKAVADGAVIWRVIGRSYRHVLRFSYGFMVSTKFDPEADDHQGRETYASSEGYEKVSGAWSQIVSKGDRLEYDDVVHVPFNRRYMSSCADLDFFSASLFAYSMDEKPSFARDQQGKLLDGFRKICTMTADLSGLRGGLQEIAAPGKSYWSLKYDLCLRFGGVELGASIEWKEKGVTRTAPVKVKPVEVVYLD
ncbi:hypothetical protein BDV93DRAFT_502306 [Ceratobasidium sp. AG-I]|nr:hypothetical protein BDV93DRAFT_502306 [Ceratobasidium sp. AG-I]